jgi:hypothetical protein
MQRCPPAQRDFATGYPSARPVAPYAGVPVSIGGECFLAPLGTPPQPEGRAAPFEEPPRPARPTVFPLYRRNELMITIWKMTGVM